MPANRIRCVERESHDNCVSVLDVVEQDLTVYHHKHLEVFYLSYQNVPRK